MAVNAMVRGQNPAISGQGGKKDKIFSTVSDKIFNNLCKTIDPLFQER